jgi:hypothetical protein
MPRRPSQRTLNAELQTHESTFEMCELTEIVRADVYPTALKAKKEQGEFEVQQTSAEETNARSDSQTHPIPRNFVEFR